MNQNFVVSILEDENDGDFSAGDLSLREAIVLANETEGADTIVFDESLNGGTITFDEANDLELIINDSVAIQGLGQNNLTLNGGFIFTPQTDVDLSIDGLNLTGGKIDSFGNLTLTNSTISQTIGIEGNSADNSAIISRGRAVISDSSIVDNSSNFAGNTGVFIESGMATIERSTIADNTAISVSGITIGGDATVDLINSTVANNLGRTIGGIDNDGSLNVVNSTVVNNATFSRGGDRIGQINNTGNTKLTSSIVASNNDSSLTDLSGDGEYVSGGNNLISNGDNVGSFVDSDLVGTADNPIDPQLGELQDNGGSTPTRALQEGSPAINAGSNPNNLETDRRGEGFERTVGDSTDIGAFEVQESTLGSEIRGTNGDDELSGTVDNDVIFGLAGNDTLTGGNGGDTIDGGSGDDLVTGGDNNDIFVLNTEGGIDTISDFGNGNDLLGLPEEISFGDLSFSGSEIIFGDSTLAVLDLFDTTTLTESDFVSGDFLSI